MLLRHRRNWAGLVTLLTLVLTSISPTPLLAQESTASLRNQAVALHRKGQSLMNAGRRDEAIKAYEEALRLAIRGFGRDNGNTANIMFMLGLLYVERGSYPAAEPLLEHCVKINQTVLKSDNPTLAIQRYLLGKVYSATNRLADAEPLLQRALKAIEARPGPYESKKALVMGELASVYQQRDKYQDAETLFLRAIKAAEGYSGPDQAEKATLMAHLATLYIETRRYDEAEPLLQKVLNIRESHKAKNDPVIGKTLSNIASIYMRTGRYAEAEPLMLRATEINAADPKGETDITAGCLMSLANLYVRMGRFAEAEPLLRHAVEIIEPFGPKLPYYAAVQHNLATFYLASGRYAEAEPIYKRLLKTYEVKYGPESTAIGMVLGDLAEISKDTGRYDEAGEFLQRALRIYEVTLRIDNPDVADKLVSLANLYAAQDRWDDAALLFDRARRVQGRFLNRTLSALAEDDQLTLLRTSDRDGLQSSLSLGLTRLSSTEDVRRSAAWVINGKAVTLNALAQRALLARDAVNPKASPIVRRLSDTRRRLSALTVAPFEVGQGGEGMRREIEHFSKQERELSRQLGQALGRPVRNDPWVELADVRIALPAGSTLVEFAKFDVRDFRAKGQERKWQPPRYAAWVIPPAGRGEIRLVDLGPAKEIEDAVAAARSVIQLDLAQFSAEGKGEPAAERRVLPPLKALGQLVLTPLLPHLAASTRWVLSPDAALWLIPWQALPLEDGRYAVEGHIIDLEVSGRDLVEPRPKPAGNPPVVVADPDFDASPRQARVEGERRLREQHRSNPEMLALRGLPRALSLGENAPRLPSTAAEAAAVTPALASYYKTEPAVYTGQLASETVFKAVSRPKALVLSTHGFFLEGVERKPDEGMNKAPGRPARGADGLSGNPLVRCGLLLAGCNQRRQVEPGSADEDGVLTGLEIVGSDLRGTDLVVLSACETGLGEVRNGEGVAGLRQAFQLAGAQAVVATLWQVPDKDSARLMKAFFDSMSTGGGKAEALRQAQLKQIASRREQYGAAHPFFWAAYTVTGDPGTGSH